jgi:hypothetical protein
MTTGALSQPLQERLDYGHSLADGGQPADVLQTTS